MSQASVKMEVRSVVERLGLRSCRTSVLMSPGAAVEIGRRWDLYPDLEKGYGVVRDCRAALIDG